MVYLDLLIGFLKVGLFSFGGGYVSIALIKEIVASHGWMDEEMLMYMIAVSESTPGPLMVNLATYIGSSKGGILGALIATSAVVLPAYVIIFLIILLFKGLMKNKAFQSVFDGLKPCVIGIIFATGLSVVWNNLNIQIGTGFDYTAGILTVILAAIYFGSRKIIKKGMSPILLIVISGVVGIMVYGFK